MGPNMICPFSRIRPAQETLNEYCEIIIRQLERNPSIYRIAYVQDTQRTRSTNSEYSLASQQCIKCLNKSLKEPS